jgi:hypothetical protein
MLYKPTNYGNSWVVQRGIFDEFYYSSLNFFSITILVKGKREGNCSHYIGDDNVEVSRMNKISRRNLRVRL